MVRADVGLYPIRSCAPSQQNQYITRVGQTETLPVVSRRTTDLPTVHHSRAPGEDARDRRMHTDRVHFDERIRMSDGFLPVKTAGLYERGHHRHEHRASWNRCFRSAPTVSNRYQAGPGAARNPTIGGEPATAAASEAMVAIA